MNKMKKIWTWYWILNKRFLKKYIFTAMLVCVPLLALGIKSMAGDEGVLRVLLHMEGADPDSRKVIDDILDIHGIVDYREDEDLEHAVEQVRRGKADCVWNFPDGLRDGIQKFLDEGEPLIQIYLREDTVQTKIAREQLYGEVYPFISYEVVRECFRNQPKTREIENIDEKLEQRYKQYQTERSIIEFTYMDNSRLDKNKESYLVTPLRGMLAVILFVCAMSVTMFYLQDKKEEIFVWMPVKHRKLFPYLYILTGTADGAAVTYISLYLTGTFTCWRTELPLMILYVLGITGFCCVMGNILKNVKRMGAGILGVTIVSMVLSPVFIATKQFPVIQYFLPTFYYLNGVHSSMMVVKMIIYTVCIMGAGIFLKKS